MNTRMHVCERTCMLTPDLNVYAIPKPLLTNRTMGEIVCKLLWKYNNFYSRKCLWKCKMATISIRPHIFNPKNYNDYCIIKALDTKKCRHFFLIICLVQAIPDLIAPGSYCSIWAPFTNISNYIHRVRWNYLPIPKHQSWNRWSLGIDK